MKRELKAKKIDLEQEVAVLEYLLTKAPYDCNGSGRITFVLGDEDSEAVVKILGLDINCGIVVKVSYGQWGVRQTQLEIDRWDDYCSWMGDCLAQVFAYGMFIEVMEKVSETISVLDDDTNLWSLISERNFDSYCAEESLLSYIDTDWDFRGRGDYTNPETGEVLSYKDRVFSRLKERGYTEEFLEQSMADTLPILIKADETYTRLTDTYGDSSDFAQLGVNEDGLVVCYDYGFPLRGDDCGDASMSSQDYELFSCTNPIEGTFNYVADLCSALKVFDYDNYSEADVYTFVFDSIVTDNIPVNERPALTSIVRDLSTRKSCVSPAN